MLTGIIAGTITGIPNAAMNYHNYSRSIQSKHGVQIVGWPSTCPFKIPSQISTVSNLKTLQNAISMGVCAWQRMSEAEIATINLELEKELEAGTTMKKVRKTRAKNKKNGTKTTASNTAQVEEDDESDEEERERDVNLKRKKGDTATDNDSEDNVPPLKKKKARKQPQKKGKAVTKPSKRSNITQKLPPGPSSKEFLNTTDDDGE